jgi:hypothetical protein
MSNEAGNKEVPTISESIGRLGSTTIGRLM